MDFKELYNYDSGTDYEAVVESYNAATTQAEKRDILKQQGGLIALLAKRQYQRNK